MITLLPDTPLPAVPDVERAPPCSFVRARCSFQRVLSLSMKLWLMLNCYPTCYPTFVPVRWAGEKRRSRSAVVGRACEGRNLGELRRSKVNAGSRRVSRVRGAQYLTYPFDHPRPTQNVACSLPVRDVADGIVHVRRFVEGFSAV
jgi:hypothetical protein